MSLRDTQPTETRLNNARLRSLAAIRQKYNQLHGLMDERSRRVWAATEAKAVGWGGVSLVSEAIGMARNTISSGFRELNKRGSAPRSQPGRVRRVGGGRKRLTEQQPKLLEKLKSFIEPTTRGDPQSRLRWTTLSVRNLEGALKKAGFTISYRTIDDLLKQLDFSLRSNYKRNEGKEQHPDRDAQFRYINDQAAAELRARRPVISVDCKKKEQVGNYKNMGREWRPKGDPIEVLMHDFPDPDVAKAVPYGIYDIGANKGWVNVGMSADTAQFAVESIRRWWRQMGKPCYPKTRRLLICADSGGSNGYRLHLWKRELQLFANEENLTITVCHYPPGTSKWNKIEHRLFSFITKNWRGRPLIDYRTIVNLIGGTKTKTGLTVKAYLDRKTYPRGIKVASKEMKALNLKPHKFHGEFNYTIPPQGKLT
jgi:transposase